MKMFRDPIHNVIDLDAGDKRLNQLLVDLIDSREFQRLRYIKQLGFAFFAYPSGVHTRFEHSLGVAFMAKRFIDKVLSIEEKTLEQHKGAEHKVILSDFFEKVRKHRGATIVAALLHDIGHGTLSHVTEHLLDIHHEDWSREIIEGETEIHRLLVEFDKSLPQDVLGILGGDETYPSAKIIAGQVDVDKIDYLLRDSYMTGSSYGKFDVEWLLNVLAIGIKDGAVEIGLDEGKGLSVAEDFIMARIYMFQNVYFHKISLLAQGMLKLMFERVRELGQKEAEPLFPNKSFARLFFSPKKEAKQLLGDFLEVTDLELFGLIKHLTKAEDEVLRVLADGLLNRRLFKQAPQGDTQALRDFIGASREKYYMLELGSEVLHEKLSYTLGRDKVFLFDKTGTSHQIHEKSSIIPPRAINLNFRKGYYVEAKALAEFIKRNTSQS